MLVWLLISGWALTAQSFQPLPVKGVKVTHEYYTLSYVEECEQAEWVYYKLDSVLILGDVERTNSFRPDPLVETGSAQHEDYRGSGYDRGHLAPAADMRASTTSMKESFYYSNMSPQLPSFNRGEWKKLESQIRDWALISGELFVVTGPICMDTLHSIGANKVAIPTHFYKTAYSKKHAKMIGFLLPHHDSVGSFWNYAIPVDSIERLTGLDFYGQMEDSLEQKLESWAPLESWNRVWVTDSTLTPLSNPSPPLPSRSNAQEQPIPQQQTSIQCRGTSKSTGKRCRNKTQNENGYCHWHADQAPSP